MDRDTVIEFQRGVCDRLRFLAGIVDDRKACGPVAVKAPWIKGWDFSAPGVFYEFRLRPFLNQFVLCLKTIAKKEDKTHIPIAYPKNEKDAFSIVKKYMIGLNDNA